MNPNLPVGGSAFDLQWGRHAGLPKDVTQLGLSLRYGSFRSTFEGSRSVADDDAIDALTANLALRHFFGDGWSAELSVPVGHLRYIEARGAPASRVSGFGDLAVGAEYDLANVIGSQPYWPTVTLRIGFHMPTGKQLTIGEGHDHGDDAHTHEPGVISENMVSIGTGTFGVDARVAVTKFVHRAVAFTLWGGGSQPVTTSENGLTPGSTIDLGAGVFVAALPWLTASALVSESHRSSSSEQGEGALLNSGGDVLAIDLGVGVSANEQVEVGLGGRVPIFTSVNGRQLSESFSVMAGVSLTFGKDSEDEHEHGEHADHHEHGAHTTAATNDDGEAGDVADLAIGGASFEMADAPVAGKVTVVDFWAEWCEPCHVLDGALRDLARRYPSVAVRRVEVPDLSSPVATQYGELRQGLPIVWIFDPRGLRVAELFGPDPREVEALVERLAGDVGK